ncbi:N terminal beta sandwich domain [Trypanosoma vivax]|nr:putative mucin-associated surface protein (MASP) [Trypanosoma vivax]KAH8610972.1 N terminal beta sandwich domain [Trypanosoma vivax]
MALLEREYSLPPMGELCLLVTANSKTSTSVTLLKQTEEGGEELRAEVFGTELETGVAIQLPPGRSFGVFTPTGCTLAVAAPPAVHQVCYGTTCNATRARSFADINTHLEVQRVKARRAGADLVGPQALFVSERRAAGASTYVRTLVNYAVRLGYHPLLLDAVVDTPRFAYPGMVSLYAMQHTIDIEEEMCFTPALHIFQGAGKHADPRLFMHVMQQTAQLCTERMARSDRCRVGGLFVDYGCINRSLVEGAEAWECAEERLEGSVKTNPLDVLVDTVKELGIDHIFVVGSSWLRVKVAQRLQSRLGDAATSSAAVSAATAILENGTKVQLFLLDAIESCTVPDDAFFTRQCWLQYFFGTRTSSVRPTLVTLDVSHVRLVVLGRNDANGASTFMPMDDEESQQHDEKGPGVRPSVSLTYVQLQDMDIKDRILALSAATEQEELPDGTLQRIPFSVFESRLRKGIVLGFALVESVTPTKITLLTCAAGLKRNADVCFILTEHRLSSQTAVT